MPNLRSPFLFVIAGFVPVAALSLVSSHLTARELAASLDVKAAAAIAKTGGSPVEARFASARGWPSRHPTLEHGEGLSPDLRDKVAKAVAAIPGVGGVRWSDGAALVSTTAAPLQPLHCQDDVEALLRARTIRFEGGATRIDDASNGLIDEVAAALRPCLGSIIAITGHTDSSGPEPGNLSLSLERAVSVRNALMERGIPADGLRARGVGSRYPVDGLDPSDPANRRIEFSVVATKSIRPTPVDTPGPG